MGNDASKPSNRMAVAALAHMMKMTKPQLLALRDRCLSVSGERRLGRANFLAAMTDANVVTDPDYGILENLFVMFDRTGVGWVEPLEFFAGISQLASVMDVETKLKFSLEVYDLKGSGRISREDLLAVLEAINTMSSYFGDAVLQKAQVAVIVDDMFADERALENGALVYADQIFKIANHQLVVDFASGAGTARYGTAQ